MSAPRLHLYTRAGCHLCDRLLDEAAPIVDRFGAVVEAVDIDSDADLRQRYHLSIPVLVLDGHEICRHFLDADALERALNRATTDSDS